jgi:hypothetical protein
VNVPDSGYKSKGYLARFRNVRGPSEADLDRQQGLCAEASDEVRY